MQTALQMNDLALLDDEPRVLDLRVAEALEFDRPRDIRKLIERNSDELAAYGGLRHDGANPKPQGGRPGVEYWLNEAQAILICMRSDAPRAADVRTEIIAVFQAWRHGKLVPGAPVTADLIGSIFEMKLVPVRHDIQQLDSKIARIDSNVVFLSGRVDDIVPRREFATWIKRQWNAVTVRRYACDCPCCRKTRIMGDDDNSLAELNYDHFSGRELNGVSDGWPVCRSCNHKLRTDPQFKIGRRSHFEVFQDYREQMFGRGKTLRGGVDQMEFVL